MLRLLETIKSTAPNDNPFLGDSIARSLRDRLTKITESTAKTNQAVLHGYLGEAEIRLGNEAKAISHYQRAIDLLANKNGGPHPKETQAHHRLGIAYLRLAETKNCCLRNTAESCILPIRDGGIHQNQEASKAAIVHFIQVLEHTREVSPVYMEALWLLNLAHMTLGTHPEGVPAPYLIPTAAFESEEAFPRFVNVAPQLKLNTFSLSGGAIADDFDNDLYLDLVVSSFDMSEQIRYFRNNQDGTFSDRTREAGLEGLYGGLNILQADYNNDGNLDILVLRGAWFADKGRHPNSLLRNNGDGTFRDVTFEAGLGERHFPTQTASWADYDNDGDLDLYIGNESNVGMRFPCQLFRNNGDETFTDVARQAGVVNERFSKAVLWGDYDGDAWPDLYVSNYMGPNRLYRNQGNSTFIDVAPELGMVGPRESFPIWFWDYNNDGHLDLYVAAYRARGPEVAASYLNREVDDEVLARLYRGNGKGGFDSVGKEANLVHPTAPMGSNFGDLDNDGYLDFYVGTGWPNYETLMPNLLYRNLRGERFADVTMSSGLGHLQKGHSVAFADLDNDGDQDIFEQMGGAYPGDKYFDVLYENPGFGNHWIAIQLTGVTSNRSAIGARIRVDMVEDSKPRTIYKYVNSGGTFGANPLRQSIGLGKAEKIQQLEVFWPTTGKTQSLKEVPMDSFIRIVEGQKGFTTLSVRKLKLGTNH